MKIRTTFCFMLIRFQLNKLCSFIFIAFTINPAIAQNSFEKQPSIGLNYLLIDFQTPDNISKNGVGDLFSASTSGMTSGLSLSFLKGISNHVDLDFSLNGCFLKYPIPERPAFAEKDLLIQFTGMLNWKLFPDKRVFTPYVTLGAGLSKYKEYFGVVAPAGLGLQFNYQQEVYFRLQSQYNIRVTDRANNHLIHSLGIAGILKKKKQQRIRKVPITPANN